MGKTEYQSLDEQKEIALYQLKIFSEGFGGEKITNLKDLRFSILKFNLVNSFYDLKTSQVTTGPFKDIFFLEQDSSSARAISSVEKVSFGRDQAGIDCWLKVVKNQLVLYYYEHK